tara:strand:+ start:1577 stop:2788 length:1212 start_codon:yes stop_codon:yes gene_type:complete
MFSSKMKLNKKVLKNGLTILHEKRDVPVTTVMLGVKYGSVYEDEKEKGIAHFIEHLCFKGTEKRTARQIAFELEKVGGILNAFTSEELTAYHVKLSSQYLDLAMDVLFDIFFNPIFPEAEVKKEANVICEEIKMYNDEPRAHSIEKIKENLYNKPFGMFIGGTEKNIHSMSRKQLLDNHQKIYVPENSILAVVGNNDFEDVIRFAEKFCVERKGEEQEVPKISFLKIKNEEKRSNLQQANVVLGFHFPTSSEKKRYASEVFSTILGSGMSSKLFTEVREKRGLVYTVKTDLDLGENYGYLIIYAGTEKSKVKEVIDICLKEFHEMKNLTKKELDEAKEQVIGNYHVGLENSDSTALNLILEEVSSSKGAESFYEYAKNIKKVSLEDIKKLAAEDDYSSFILSP